MFRECVKQEFRLLHGRVNQSDTAPSSTYSTRVWKTAEFPRAQHSCLSPFPSPHLASPPLTPMSLFTHPLVCLERQHTTAPPPPTAPASPFLHPDNPATPPPYPPSSSLEIWGARCTLFSSCSPPSFSPGAFWFLLSPSLLLFLFHIPECFFSSVHLIRSWVLLKVSVCGTESWQSLFLKVLAH